MADNACDLVIAVIPRAREVIAKVRTADKHLADQLRRALTSIALNLAEADGNRDGNRRVRLETAHGSASEAKVAVRVALAWQYVSEDDAKELCCPHSTVWAR